MVGEPANFGVPLGGSLIPWIDAMGPMATAAMSRGSGRAAPRPQDPRPGPGFDTEATPIDSLCVRVGAMRCHSQALTIKLEARRAAGRRACNRLDRCYGWILPPGLIGDALKSNSTFRALCPDRCGRVRLACLTRMRTRWVWQAFRAVGTGKALRAEIDSTTASRQEADTLARKVAHAGGATAPPA